MKEPPTIQAQVPLSNHDLANLIAFGNRASMSGAEADTWVELKTRLITALAAADEEAAKPLIETGEDIPTDVIADMQSAAN